jgi:hypothetical protein
MGLTRSRFQIPVFLIACTLQGCATAPECPRSQSGADLKQFESTDVSINLPTGSRGPYGGDSDTSDYYWDTPIGQVWMLYGKATPTDFGARKITSATVGVDAVTLYRWRDYDKQDRLIAEWETIASPSKRKLVNVPVNWNDCNSINLAHAVVDSARFINDPSQLRVDRLAYEPDVQATALINELGERRRVKIGDVVTRDHGVIVEVDAEGIIVRNWERSNDVWRGWRITASDSHLVPACTQLFRDDEIIDTVKRQLHVDYEAKYSVHWDQSECAYYVVIYPLPITPELHTFVKVNADGEIADVDKGPH